MDFQNDINLVVAIERELSCEMHNAHIDAVRLQIALTFRTGEGGGNVETSS